MGDRSSKGIPGNDVAGFAATRFGHCRHCEPTECWIPHVHASHPSKETGWGPSAEFENAISFDFSPDLDIFQVDSQDAVQEKPGQASVSPPGQTEVVPRVIHERIETMSAEKNIKLDIK